MNPFAAMFNRTLPDVLDLTPAHRLAATLRPDPDARAKRLSQWPRERQQRYLDACYGEPQSLRQRNSPVCDRNADVLGGASAPSFIKGIPCD